MLAKYESAGSLLSTTTANISVTAASGGGGLSERDKIILGVVLGVGLFLILLVILAIILYKCTNCMRGKKDGRYEVAKEFTVLGAKVDDKSGVGQSNV